MTTREHFSQDLRQMRADTLKMGELVDKEITMALEALARVDMHLAHDVRELDEQVNQARFALEEKCTVLLATQQPFAGDLRRIVAAMHIFVDLERMGDQAKGIAKIIPRLNGKPHLNQPSELHMMGELGVSMLRDCLQAYDELDIDLAKLVIYRDEAVDKLYANLYTQTMFDLVGANNSAKTEACYQLLRAGRELERFADLATNIAERVIYIATGHLEEGNLDHDDVLDKHID
ncbi:MAG: phosphate signaling complex protein PhoU [Anaerolineaceae bacterium]|nr:phosphate signaling complex protein PhoU [Anaerolineaceae bacterium]MCB9100812.1 phosphate signaling complex protein PhoU [Anaerolineales bacterium]